MPDTDVRFVGKETGPIETEGGALILGATHSLAETPCPDIVVVPGGTRTPGQMVDDEVLEWATKGSRNNNLDGLGLYRDANTGAAGLLKGLPATTHWYKMGGSSHHGQ